MCILFIRLTEDQVHKFDDIKRDLLRRRLMEKKSRQNSSGKDKHRRIPPRKDEETAVEDNSSSLDNQTMRDRPNDAEECSEDEVVQEQARQQHFSQDSNLQEPLESTRHEDLNTRRRLNLKQIRKAPSPTAVTTEIPRIKQEPVGPHDEMGKNEETAVDDHGNALENQNLGSENNNEELPNEPTPDILLGQAMKVAVKEESHANDDHSTSDEAPEEDLHPEEENEDQEGDQEAKMQEDNAHALDTDDEQLDSMNDDELMDNIDDLEFNEDVLISESEDDDDEEVVQGTPPPEAANAEELLEPLIVHLQFAPPNRDAPIANMCCVCLTAPACVLIIGCGTVILCGVCAVQVQQEMQFCPHCRGGDLDENGQLRMQVVF
jgi:Zinc finger, C3HC4 type (RING finger)